MSNNDEKFKVYSATGGAREGGSEDHIVGKPDVIDGDGGDVIQSSHNKYNTLDMLFNCVCAAIRKDLGSDTETYTIQDLYTNLQARADTTFNTSNGLVVTRANTMISSTNTVMYVCTIDGGKLQCGITNLSIQLDYTPTSTSGSKIYLSGTIGFENGNNIFYPDSTISYEYIKQLSNTIPLDGLNFYFCGIGTHDINTNSNPTQAVKILRQLSGLYALPTYPLCTIDDLTFAMDNPGMIQNISYLLKPGYFTESCTLEGKQSPYSWIPLLLYIWMPIIVRYESDIKNKHTSVDVVKEINKKLLEAYETSCIKYNPIIWRMTKSDIYIPKVDITSTTP
jgi:hypothetical protein